MTRHEVSAMQGKEERKIHTWVAVLVEVTGAGTDVVVDVTVAIVACQPNKQVEELDHEENVQVGEEPRADTIPLLM